MTIEPLERPAVIEAAPVIIAVVVTQDDIDQGWQHSAWKCAISLAFARLGIRAGIGERAVAIIGGDEYICRNARAWISAFDRDKAQVHPERFVWHRVGRRE